MSINFQAFNSLNHFKCDECLKTNFNFSEIPCYIESMDQTHAKLHEKNMESIFKAENLLRGSFIHQLNKSGLALSQYYMLEEDYQLIGQMVKETASLFNFGLWDFSMTECFMSNLQKSIKKITIKESAKLRNKGFRVTQENFVTLVKIIALIEVRESCNKMHNNDANTPILILIDQIQPFEEEEQEEIEDSISVTSSSMTHSEINSANADPVSDDLKNTLDDLKNTLDHSCCFDQSSVEKLCQGSTDDRMETDETLSLGSSNAKGYSSPFYGANSCFVLSSNDYMSTEGSQNDTKISFVDLQGDDSQNDDLSSHDQESYQDYLCSSSKKIKKTPLAAKSPKEKKVNPKFKPSALKNWVRIFFMMVINLINSEKLMPEADIPAEVSRFISCYTSRKIDTQAKLYQVIKKSHFWRQACLSCLENHYDSLVDLSEEIKDKKSYKDLKATIKAKILDPSQLHH